MLWLLCRFYVGLPSVGFLCCCLLGVCVVLVRVLYCYGTMVLLCLWNSTAALAELVGWMKVGDLLPWFRALSEYLKCDRFDAAERSQSDCLNKV